MTTIDTETSDIYGSVAALQKGEYSSSAVDTEEEDGSDLGKNTFLELLSTQLQYQDPLDPIDNSQMLAQLAQFSSLEQMSNLNTSFEMVKAMQMIGSYVTAVDEDGDAIAGIVESVSKSGTGIMVNVYTDDSTSVQTSIENVENVIPLTSTTSTES